MQGSLSSVLGTQILKVGVVTGTRDPNAGEAETGTSLELTVQPSLLCGSDPMRKPCLRKHGRWYLKTPEMVYNARSHTCAFTHMHTQCSAKTCWRGESCLAAQPFPLWGTMEVVYDEDLP